MDDYQMARLALDAVRTAARLAQQEQRRRERNRNAAARESAAQNRTGQNRAGQGRDPDQNAVKRRPEFDMPVNPDGEIPDEFLPRA